MVARLLLYISSFRLPVKTIRISSYLTMFERLLRIVDVTVGCVYNLCHEYSKMLNVKSIRFPKNIDTRPEKVDYSGKFLS